MCSCTFGPKAAGPCVSVRAKPLCCLVLIYCTLVSESQWHLFFLGFCRHGPKLTNVTLITLAVRPVHPLCACKQTQPYSPAHPGPGRTDRRRPLLRTSLASAAWCQAPVRSSCPVLFSCSLGSDRLPSLWGDLVSQRGPWHRRRRWALISRSL